MARTDRSVRRARRHLTDDEVVMASAMAIEDEGRRRQVVVVTDHRVLVTGLRGDTSVEFPLDGSTCGYERAGGRLTLRSDERELVVREVDELASRTILTLLAARATRRSAQEAVRLGHSRIGAF
jgi:hypothetical protein